MKFIKTFDQFLNEKKQNENTTKFIGVPKYITPLLIDYVEFCKKLLKIEVDIIVNFKKINKKEIGFVNFSNVINGKNEIIVDKNANYRSTLEYISHELTHIKQINNKELLVDDGYFVWQNKKELSIKEYNMICNNYDIDAYVNLEWEKEAYTNQRNFVNSYIASDFFKTLVNNVEEPNLKFILQYI